MNTEQREAEIDSQLAALSGEVDSMIATAEANTAAAARHLAAATAAQSEIAAKQARIVGLRNELGQLQGALPGETWDDFRARTKCEQAERYCV